MALGKLGQLNDLRKMRSQAMALQKQLEKEEVTVESGNIRVKVNGAQQIIYIEIEGDAQGDLVDVINDAMKKVQKVAAKKMMEEGGGLGGLLGGS